MSYPIRPPSNDPPPDRALPLSLLRIWTRRHESWLSFATNAGDRYLIGTRGYFIELPDGQLTAVSPRTAFPVVNRYPSVRMSDLTEQSQYGRGIRFVTVPETGARSGKPRGISLEELSPDDQEGLSWLNELGPVEHYVALRVLEAGLVPDGELADTVSRANPHATLGQLLLDGGLVSWEPLLALCLDTRQASRFDPPQMRALANRKEWERTGEVLIALGRINRTSLEQGLSAQRDGHQALGQILTAMGACTDEDIEECLNIQKEVRNTKGSGVAMVGQLLVSQGVVAPEALEEALRNQRVARYSLERILISMGACTKRDIEDFARINSYSRFQDEIDDIALGHWLVKIGTITRQQLDEALRVQMRGRQVLGEMLIALKLCEQEDIEKMLRLQKDIRRNHSAGIERLGGILLKKGKVDPSKLEAAISIQTMGRQPLGAILVALGACSVEDVQLALNIQKLWRERPEAEDDLLGEVLVRAGVVSRSSLNELLPLHKTQATPLGRLLIERDLCTPEQIIESLLKRDYKRHQDFLTHVARTAPPPAATPPRPTARKTTELEASLLTRVSSWLLRKPNKSGGARDWE